MTAVWIIGYGNPLAGDDAVGWHAAEALQAELCDPAVRVLACRQLTPELAAEIGAAGLVIFLDAGVDVPPGVVQSRRVAPRPEQSPFSHHLTPEALLAVTERLYGCSPEAVLFSVGARWFSSGAGLSGEVRRALPVLLEQVRELLRRVRAAADTSPPVEPQQTGGDLFSLMH